MKIFLVAGARPNFVKIAPIERALRMHRDRRLEVRDQPSTQSYAVPRRSEDGKGQRSEVRGQRTAVYAKLRRAKEVRR